MLKFKTKKKSTVAKSVIQALQNLTMVVIFIALQNVFDELPFCIKPIGYKTAMLLTSARLKIIPRRQPQKKK